MYFISFHQDRNSFMLFITLVIVNYLPPAIYAYILSTKLRLLNVKQFIEHFQVQNFKVYSLLIILTLLNMNNTEKKMLSYINITSFSQ